MSVIDGEITLISEKGINIINEHGSKFIRWEDVEKIIKM